MVGDFAERQLLSMMTLAILIVAGGAVPVHADEQASLPTGYPECPTEDCALTKARDFIAKDNPQEAIRVLKNARNIGGESSQTSIALANAYLKSKNAFWAIRTLAQWLDGHPDDCEAISWLARVFIEQAGFDQARSTLDHKTCMDSATYAGRFALLEVWMAQTEGNSDLARANLDRAYAAPKMSKSDRRALESLARMLEPSALPDITWRIEQQTGYSSNPRMGSVTDEIEDLAEDPGSAMFQTDAYLRFVPRTGGPIRPSLELSARLYGLTNSTVKRLSYIDVGGRAGLLIGSSIPRVFVGYRPDYLILPGGLGSKSKGPTGYYLAHRAEVEIEATPWLLIFAGGGKRTFTETARTRYEGDLGVGGSVTAGKVGNFLWATSGRIYRTPNKQAFNLFGWTALAAMHFGLPAGFGIRPGVSMSMDFYPDSGLVSDIPIEDSRTYDPFGSIDSRRDILIKPGLQAWSPSWAGLKVGISYDFSYRESTAPDYSFNDHRVALRIRYSGDSDLRKPTIADNEGWGDFDWDDVVGNGNMDERIQDLLRQDEQVQRSSSCMD